MSWPVGRFRASEPASAAATGEAASDASVSGFRAGTPAGTALPLLPSPSLFPIGTTVQLRNLAGNPNVLGLWFLGSRVDGVV